MRRNRVLSILSLILVAGIAAWVSYWHMCDLAAANGQQPVSAHLLPGSADGLVAVAAIAMAVDRAAGCRRRRWAVGGFWVGVMVSVAANWFATSGGVLAHVISAWAPLAFLACVEIMTSAGKPLVKPVHEEDIPWMYRSGPVSDTVSDIVPDTDTPAEQPVPAPRRAPRKRTTAERVADAWRRTPKASVADIARRVGVTERTVRRYPGPDAAPVDGHAVPELMEVAQ